MHSPPLDSQQYGALSVDAYDIRLRGKTIAYPGDIFDVDGSAPIVLDRIRFRSAIVWGAALGMETSYSLRANL